MRNIQKKIAHMLVVAGMLIAVLACSSGAVFAQDTQKKNSETGYKAIIEDDGSALSSDEIDKLHLKQSIITIIIRQGNMRKIIAIAALAMRAALYFWSTLTTERFTWQQMVRFTKLSPAL